MSFKKESVDIHKKYRGKIEIKPKFNINSRKKLAIAYTPGVAEVSKKIAKNKKEVDKYTNRANQIAIISDGTAVLGLGDVGPEAGLPVMEGKSAIFKSFAGVDAVPLCIYSKDVDEIVRFCKNIQPNFAGINLEDIAAPRCFEILERLESELNIPVFHDDQDGTAIVALAALINALKVVEKDKENIKVVINGAGAAGISIAKLLNDFNVGNIVLLDSKGSITKNRSDLTSPKQEIAKLLGFEGKSQNLEDSLKQADVFLGVSKGNLLKKDMIKKMNSKPIIFAMANPDPEILPKEARKAGAAVVGTGRSDFDNQINNALVFPGIFRGLLDSKKSEIDSKMKIKASFAIANLIKKPNKNRILPSVTNKEVVKVVSEAVKN